MITLSISRYIAYLASGSDISSPDADSGYDTGLVAELARIGIPHRAALIKVTPAGARDLAEWLDAIGSAEGQNRNHSGAAACARLAERARMEANSHD